VSAAYCACHACATSWASTRSTDDEVVKPYARLMRVKERGRPPLSSTVLKPMYAGLSRAASTRSCPEPALVTGAVCATVRRYAA
jgi:hypothetical protein